MVRTFVRSLHDIFLSKTENLLFLIKAKMPDEHRGNVSVFIYEPELDFLKWLVLQKCDIETGGDLFGLWQDENTAVVQLILGPGAKCKRTTTSFHQDVDYLADAGGE